MSEWPSCPNCRNPKPAGVVDPDLDCIVGWECTACGHAWKRDLGEVLAVAAPAAFKEPRT